MEKIFFSKNIKFLRERKKIVQENLAGELSMTRSKLNALESGQTKAPQPEDYIRFSEYFKISVDSLLKVDLGKIGELRLRQLEAGNDVYIRGGNLRVLAISTDQHNRENVTVVTKKGQAGYFEGYNDPEYIGQLPTFNMPTLPENRTCRMFPIEGKSMQPFPEKMYVIADYVSDWTLLKEGELCVVVLKSVQQILFKSVRLGKESGTYVLHSYNRDFQEVVVKAEDILEIWKYRSYLTEIIPEQVNDLAALGIQVASLRSEFSAYIKSK